MESYLMWIGKEHYPTIKDYVDEALERGISKRLANADMGKALMSDDVVVFLAHDEGEYRPCEDCLGLVECPECRKLDNEVARLQKEWDDLAAEDHKLKDGETVDPKIIKRRRSIKKRIAKIQTSKKDCKCGGEGTLYGGTGGSVKVDGEAWDVRKYEYWLHQPKKWKPEDHEIEDFEKCPHCGGHGRLPVGKVFGLFVPGKIEYILKGEDDEIAKKAAEERGFRIVTEKEVAKEVKRGCGKRKPGGYYAVTEKEGGEKDAEKAIAELVERGVLKPEGTQINGQFAEFIEHVDINEKRFRGIKRWFPSTEAAEEAEMIRDALAE